MNCLYNKPRLLGKKKRCTLIKATSSEASVAGQMLSNTVTNRIVSTLIEIMTVNMVLTRIYKSYWKRKKNDAEFLQKWTNNLKSVSMFEWRVVWFYSVQYVWVISDRCGWDLSQKYWACTHVRLISSQEREIVILAYDDSAMLSVLWVSCRLLITGTLGVYWCRTYLTRVISRESSHLKRERVNPNWLHGLLRDCDAV